MIPIIPKRYLLMHMCLLCVFAWKHIELDDIFWTATKRDHHCHLYGELHPQPYPKQGLKIKFPGVSKTSWVAWNCYSLSRWRRSGSPGDWTRTGIVTDVWICGGSGECTPTCVFNSAMSFICLLSGGDFTKTPFRVVGASSTESVLLLGPMNGSS